MSGLFKFDNFKMNYEEQEAMSLEYVIANIERLHDFLETFQGSCLMNENDYCFAFAHACEGYTYHTPHEWDILDGNKLVIDQQILMLPSGLMMVGRPSNQKVNISLDSFEQCNCSKREYISSIISEIKDMLVKLN